MKLFLKRWVVTHMELAPWNSQAHRAFFCFGKSRIQWVAGHAAVIVGRVGTKRYCPDYNSLALLTLLTTPSFDEL